MGSCRLNLSQFLLIGACVLVTTASSYVLYAVQQWEVHSAPVVYQWLSRSGWG